MKNKDSLLFKVMAEFEQRYLRDALLQRGWKKKKTARELGISYKTLFNKINRFDLAPEVAAAIP